MRILFVFLFIFVAACIPSDAPADTTDNRILDIQKVTSKGGITAWLVEDNKLPIIAMSFTFEGAGAVHNTPEQQGLARLLSNTMDEGAGKLTSQEFQKTLNDNSISLSFGSARDHFGGQVTTLSRHKDKAFNLLKLALNEPRFDEEPVERMRLANLSRIKSSMGNPNWIAARIYNDLAYDGHPYALNSGGTLTTLNDITIDDLKSYKQKWLTKNRLKIGVSGDISAKELSVLLDDVFGTLPSGKQEEDITKSSIQNLSEKFIYKKDIPQTLIKISFDSFDRTDDDYYALRVMNHIFGESGFGSRLMEEAREKRGLTYGIYSNVMMGDYINSYNISTSTKTEATQEMLDVIQSEIDKIVQSGVSEDELQKAKDYIIGSMPLGLTSTGRIAGIALDLQINNRAISYLDDFPKKIKDVSAEDVKRVAKRIFENKKPLIVMVGEPDINNAKILKEKLPNVE